MAQKITDPATYLRNLVCNKGRSDLEGVYLTGVNVQADPHSDYGYDVSLSSVEDHISGNWSTQAEKWNQLLVNTRLRPDELVHSITFRCNGDDVTVCFIIEDHEMSCLVFIPKLEVSEFVYEVTFYQQVLQKVAAFAGKNPNSLRFVLGVASILWADMVDLGYAREVDVGF